MKITNKIIVFNKECTFCGRQKTLPNGKKVVFQYNLDKIDNKAYCCKAHEKAYYSMNAGA